MVVTAPTWVANGRADLGGADPQARAQRRDARARVRGELRRRVGARLLLRAHRDVHGRVDEAALQQPAPLRWSRSTRRSRTTSLPSSSRTSRTRWSSSTWSRRSRRPATGAGSSPPTAWLRVRDNCIEYHAREALTDQHHAASLVDLASRDAVQLTPVPWTAATKGARFETVRTLMRGRRTALSGATRLAPRALRNRLSP